MEKDFKLDISGILSLAGKKDVCVICCHGIRSDKSEWGNFTKLSQKLQENGISCYRFDFTGHGESTRDFSEFCISEGIKDLEKAIEYVEQLGYQKNCGVRRKFWRGNSRFGGLLEVFEGRFFGVVVPCFGLFGCGDF